MYLLNFVVKEPDVVDIVQETVIEYATDNESVSSSDSDAESDDKKKESSSSDSDSDDKKADESSSSDSDADDKKKTESEVDDKKKVKVNIYEETIHGGGRCGSTKYESKTETLKRVTLTDITSCITTSTNCSCSTPDVRAAMTTLAAESNVSNVPKLTCNESLNVLLSVYNCNTERCVLANMKETVPELLPQINKSLENIKPKGPFNSTKWLSNADLDNVLKSYQKQYPKFKFYPSCLMNESFTSIDLYQDIISDDVDSVACVVNTTEVCSGSGSCGEHWVCIYMEKTSSAITLEFFNSAGSPPPPKVLRMFKTAVDNMRGDTRTIVEKLTQCPHQQNDTECGVYCLYFIRSRLEGIAFERFTNSTMISDEAMIMFRRYIFDIPLNQQ